MSIRHAQPNTSGGVRRRATIVKRSTGDLPPLPDDPREALKVLAIDQSASSDKNEPVVVRAVTLEVTPADAEKLILAEQRGSIQLALRNPLDEKVTAKAAKAAPVVHTKAPPPSPSVSVIRGTDMGKEVPKDAVRK